MPERLEADVAIVGSGPAGVAAALALRQRGVRDVLLLDAHDFPRHETCGSGLSPRAIAGTHPAVQRAAARLLADF